MQTQLLEDLQNMQKKADGFFNEAKEDQSEHAGGYFFLARKIDKMIGYVTNVRNIKKPLMSLSELRQRLLDIAHEYGKKTGVSYEVEIDIKCNERGEFSYGSNITGLKKDPKQERYSNPGRIYSADSFNELVLKFEEILKKDAELRAEDPEQGKDVVVK